MMSLGSLVVVVDITLINWYFQEEKKVISEVETTNQI